MLVTFISQCEKKALARTRRVLDAFADRIGSNAWQTVITEDGLITVKNLLRKTATKNTAVACHWARSRSRSDLVWIVGNRKRFNSEGIVPVNVTQRNVLNAEWENNWTYLPLIKSLVALSALLHDWGKATLLFQQKLKNSSRLGDPLRHEWISCLLLHALVQHSGDYSTDEKWLALLMKGNWHEESLVAAVKENPARPLHDLPPLAQLVSWLIVTHHRMPALLEKASYNGEGKYTISSILRGINANWGYQNTNENDPKRLDACFEFPYGLISQSQAWNKALQKWSSRLWAQKEMARDVLENGAWRVVLHHARLSLMLGDHYYSSCSKDDQWNSGIELYANTHTHNHQSELKQKLDEHLVRVSDNALRIAQSLSRFSTDMDSADTPIQLKKKSPQGFEWQDHANNQLTTFIKKTQQENPNAKEYGWFIVNMASTGCGKTVANAKIMRALSSDGNSLRFILALGLRTLTLQTGDEYRQRIGLDDGELAVLIGSTAVKELHEQRQKNSQDLSFEEEGSESQELLLLEDLNYADAPTADFLDTLFPKHKSNLAQKNKAFLYKPVLACTIDHVITATETIRGGKYILPCLRLLSSDLVIDEIDDFEGQDLIAIGRLIHLAGMLGRKVMISSATIPPALAEGFFNTYQAGWTLHHHFMGADARIACAWVDEFTTQIKWADEVKDKRCVQYAMQHHTFIQTRIAKLIDQPIKRKAMIVRCDELFLRGKPQNDKQKISEELKISIEQAYFGLIKRTVVQLHEYHHTIDEKTGKKVSFGAIRVANIPPCVKLTRYLLQCEWSEDISPKVMAYHSRQILLLRHEQEKHLDSVLKRKESAGQPPQAFNLPKIRQYLDSTPCENVIFIVVATPVEEVGRDHDFDWAIIEPSSYRSIIQMAGRVRRHRDTAIDQPNIALMQYNLRALRHDQGPVFIRPGYEKGKNLRLTSRNLDVLLDEQGIAHSLTAIPRIYQSLPLQPQIQLADLEHQAIRNTLTDYNAQGPQALQSWLHECWWMTALPQQNNRFRANNPDINVYLLWVEGRLKFYEKGERGEWISCASMLGITDVPPFTALEQSRLWLNRDYEFVLRQHCGFDLDQKLNSEEQRIMQEKSERYGEMSMPDREKDQFTNAYSYSDDLGLFPLARK
ncbi:type I-F CRISPR-associated helicase Cas3f [Aquirhabdus sp.]|uniref:type I-F CRISPR-associated helicase Cas3f n=1 Tax=Aquirhabdus sp. TaxID=2824160 RepID=UPI00396C36E4